MAGLMHMGSKDVWIVLCIGTIQLSLGIRDARHIPRHEQYQLGLLSYFGKAHASLVPGETEAIRQSMRQWCLLTYSKCFLMRAFSTGSEDCCVKSLGAFTLRISLG